MVDKPRATFDIVKVRLQVQANENAIRVAKNILSQEGALAFYKVDIMSRRDDNNTTNLCQGSIPPLLGAGVCVRHQYLR